MRLSEVGGRLRTGTGFFVAPGHVITCAHVVEPDDDSRASSFTIQGDFGTAEAAPEELRPNGLADLALFRIDEKNHPVVLLSGAAEVGDPVWTQGFVSQQNEIRLEPAAGEIEGERRAKLETGGLEYTLIKFRGAQIIPGMSGAPLLNRRTGGVCGVVAKTLNENMGAGGLAVPFRIILACYPALRELQGEYHRSNSQWRMANIMVPSPGLTERDKIQILLSLPEGPAVLLAEVPLEVINVFYGLTALSSLQVVHEANNLRLRAGQPQMQAFRIALVGLPNPEKVGVIEYWHEAFAAAASRGPRMLAGLLYAAPPGTFDGLDQIIADFLANLRTWPIR